MKPRVFLSIGLMLLCLALSWRIVLEQEQISALNAQRKALLAPATTPASTESGHSDDVSPELLRLRSDVARLAAQQRELSKVRIEQDRLRRQSGAGQSNDPDSSSNVYITTEAAQFTGFNSPEDTVQSVLWSIQNHDFDKFLQAFNPKMVETMNGNGDPFQEMTNLTAVQILARAQLPDGTVELTIQPWMRSKSEQPNPETTRFYLENGEWKITDEHWENKP